MAVGLCNIKNLQKNIWKTVSYRKLNKLSAHVEKLQEMFVLRSLQSAREV